MSHDPLEIILHGTFVLLNIFVGNYDFFSGFFDEYKNAIIWNSFCNSVTIATSHYTVFAGKLPVNHC